MNGFSSYRLVTIAGLALLILGGRVSLADAHWHDPCEPVAGGYILIEDGGEQLGFFQRLIRPRYWQVRPIRYIFGYHSHGSWQHAHPRILPHSHPTYSWVGPIRYGHVSHGEPTPLKQSEWRSVSPDQKTGPTATDGDTDSTQEQTPADQKPSLEQGNLSPSEAHLLVTVPSQTRLFVNDKLTQSKGTKREFFSRGLLAGQPYRYRLRAEIQRGNETIVQNKTVFITAGQQLQLALTPPPVLPQMKPVAPQAAQTQLASHTQSEPTRAVPSRPKSPAVKKSVVMKPVTTEIILHVPSGASIDLAGVQLPSGGPIRLFRTTKLTHGQQWKDYKIEVRIRRGGHTRIETKTINVKAGDKRELRFTFDS